MKMSSNAACFSVIMLISSCNGAGALVDEVLIWRATYSTGTKKGCKWGCSCNVAFSSYISEDSANSQSASMANRDIILFDKTEANYGVGYNTSTGKFIAPSSGVYGFTWTFCVDSRTTDGGALNYGEYGTELLTGNSVIGVLHTDTEMIGDDACSTGFVIKYVSEGTEVYVRNNYAHQGKILSGDNHTRTTFSGWKLYQ